MALLLALLAPVVLVGLALAVAAVHPGSPPHPRVRPFRQLTEPADLRMALRDDVAAHSPEWAAALRS